VDLLRRPNEWRKDRIYATAKVTKIAENGLFFVRFVSLAGNRFRPDPFDPPRPAFPSARPDFAMH
jgi:hypothetical protein